MKQLLVIGLGGFVGSIVAGKIKFALAFFIHTIRHAYGECIRQSVGLDSLWVFQPRAIVATYCTSFLMVGFCGGGFTTFSFWPKT